MRIPVVEDEREDRDGNGAGDRVFGRAAGTGATFTFVGPGQVVAMATADRRGSAAVELDVKLPGAAATR